MADKPQPKFQVDAKYQYKYRSNYSNDWDSHQDYVQNFDAWEDMLTSQVFDEVTRTTTSKITDSYATTLAKERADRVVAKLPEGVVEPLGKSDVGKAAFMEILRQKWIYPNANAQHSFLEKMNMWQFYSSVYGYMPMFYDWNVNASGYAGPDCWLWNPRNLVPQAGRASINDMDYVTALTWVGERQLKQIIDNYDNEPKNPDGTPINKVDLGGWDIDALRILVEHADDVTMPDSQKDSKVVRDRSPQATRRGICLATRYEAGDDGNWVTFAPNHAYIQVRKLKNPHKNGRIPFVIKYSQPLFDSFYGLGDFQRAMPLQAARDGLTNFYFEGIKMNLIPPIVANANGVIKHTLDYRAGAVMMETITGSVRRLETSTAGLATYQAAQSNLTGSLLSLYGSQNASIASGDSLNPEQGKTPQAIDLYSNKEADRDGSERRHLVDAMQQLTNGFFSLIVNIGTESIPVGLLAQDIEDIAKSGMSDIKDLFNKNNFEPNDSDTAAVLKIDQSKLKDIEFRFMINPDSTAAVNKNAILQSIKDFMTQLGAIQNVITEDPTMTVHWDKIMTAYEEASGIPGASEFVSFDPEAKKAPEPVPQMTNPVDMGNGLVRESADLDKLVNTLAGIPEARDTVNAILEKMQLPPIGPPAPEAGPGATFTAGGHMFNDPDVGSAADKLFNLTQQPLATGQAPSEPTISKSGTAFDDPTIAAAADALGSHPEAMNMPDPIEQPVVQ